MSDQLLWRTMWAMSRILSRVLQVTETGLIDGDDIYPPGTACGEQGALKVIGNEILRWIEVKRRNAVEVYGGIVVWWAPHLEGAVTAVVLSRLSYRLPSS